MKKVLAQLFLISFLAVLLVPVTASAVECPNCQDFSVQCTCGANVLPPTIGTGAQGTQYCLNGVVKSSLSGCLADAGTTGGTGGSTSISTISGLLAKLDQISTWVFQGLLIIAGIFLIIAGYFFVTGGGEPEKVNKARQMLINALIGVAIAVGAKGLVMLVQNMVQ